MEIAVSAARKAGGFCVQAYSPSPRVQALIALRRSNPNRIHLAHCASQKQTCGVEGIIWKTQGGRQIVATSRRNHGKNRLRCAPDGVQQKLEGAITPDGENARSTSASGVMGFLGEVERAVSDSQVDVPLTPRSKVLEVRENLEGEAAASGGIDKEKIGRRSRGKGGRSRAVDEVGK